MSEPDHPTLSELHEMIIGLARENSILKKQLAQTRNELRAFKDEMADIGKAFKFEVTNVTAQFTNIYQYLADIHEQLWPLVHKIFPGSLKTQQQIAAIKKNGGRGLGCKEN